MAAQVVRDVLANPASMPKDRQASDWPIRCGELHPFLRLERFVLWVYLISASAAQVPCWEMYNVSTIFVRIEFIGTLAAL